MCAEVVEYDPATRTYALCPEVRPFVTGPGADNLARAMRLHRPHGAGRAPGRRVLPRRAAGSPTPTTRSSTTSRPKRAQRSTTPASSTRSSRSPAWSAALQRGIDVADVGCGEGHAINLLARAFPRSRFTGFDFSDEALAAARAEAAAWGLTNVTFELRDVATLPTGAFDLVTAFDAIHDQAHPATVLAAIRAALRPDGTFLMVDINASSNLEDNVDLPWGSFLYAISTFHCMAVSLGQGGDGLGTVWGVQLAERMLRDAGFGDVVLHELEDDPFNAYVVARP